VETILPRPVVEQLVTRPLAEPDLAVVVVVVVAVVSAAEQAEPGRMALTRHTAQAEAVVQEDRTLPPAMLACVVVVVVVVAGLALSAAMAELVV